MSQKVGTDDGLWYLGNHENPPKNAAESKVDCDEFFAVGRNRGSVDSLETGVRRGPPLVVSGGGDDADLRTRIDQKADARAAVGNVKETRTTWGCVN